MLTLQLSFFSFSTSTQVALSSNKLFLANCNNGRAYATACSVASVIVCHLWHYVLWLNDAS